MLTRRSFNLIGQPIGILTLFTAGLIAGQAKAQSPATIAEAVELVKKAKANGASNQAVANLVMNMVDRRITNGNDWDLPGSEYDQAIKTPDGQAKIKQATDERENFGVGLGKSYGMDYALRSEWAWNLGYGNCNETSSLTYCILKDAGFTNIRMLETTANGGHAFVVFGMDPNGDPSDPTNWGDQALVVDPWRHNVLTSEEAAGNDWISANGKHKPNDVTVNYDDPKTYEFFRKKFVKKTYSSKLAEALAIQKGIEEQGQTLGTEGPARKVTRAFTKEEVRDAIKSLGLEPNIVEGNGIVRINAFKRLPNGLQPGDQQTVVRITLYRNKTQLSDYHKEKLSKEGNSSLSPADWGNMNASGTTLPGRKGDFPDQEFFPIGTAELGLLYQNLYIQVVSQKAGIVIGTGQENYKKAEQAGTKLNDTAKGSSLDFGKKLLRALGTAAGAK